MESNLIMICEECVKENKTSKLYPGISSRTDDYYPPWYDENGIYHNHDDNVIATVYNCSNGHRFTKASYQQCPSCDWNKSE